MAASFIAFMNMKGIACASDTDFTLHALTSNGFVVLAVNPDSRIPWLQIIDSYLDVHTDLTHQKLQGYVKEFEKFLATVECEKNWEKLTEDDGKIIFMGFGENDVFPVSIAVQVELDSLANKLLCKVISECKVSHKTETDFTTLTRFDEMRATLFGIKTDLRNLLLEKHASLFKQYKARVVEAVAGTPYEEKAIQFINDYDEKHQFADALNHMHDCCCRAVNTALDSFNVEDMVNLAETFVDSQDQLNHLNAGGKGLLNATRELAVITRTEGLVWIKHCFYGL